MARMIEIQIGDARAKAVLHDSTALNVCEAIWRLLPLELTFQHTNLGGRQVFGVLEGCNCIKVERESPQLFIQPGDLIYAYRAPNLGRGAKSEMSEIAFYYGRDARRWTTRGYGLVRDQALGSTIWATVVEGLEEVGRQLEEIRVGGGKRVTIRPFG